MRLTKIWLAVIGFALAVSTANADDVPVADAEFFEAKVRPLLVARCLECHGAEKPKAGLRLDSRESILVGGESGPAAIVGKTAESLLIDVIGYRNTVQMPPKAKLPDAEIATLTEWVKRGLPWPNSKPAVVNPSSKSAPVEFTDEQKSFWAFQPVQNPIPPGEPTDTWSRSPVDRFVRAELLAAGLSPARDAEKRVLIRRVTLNLTGLPPTPDEVAEFTADSSPDALEKTVDRLLASPRYGERWARHWLDIARYADSNGLDENLAYANAYHYRDYVVRAFRDDKPYDQFLIEQIAGDLLPSIANRQSLATATPETSGSTALVKSGTFDPLIATGFLCLGAKMLAEDDPVKMQMDIIDEQVDTVARAVMGLTMGCARCHDHKFDPLTVDDYYGLAGVFKSTQTMDNFSVVARWHERPLATATQLQQRDELQQIANQQKQAIDKLKAEATEVILQAARQQVGAYLLAATRELVAADEIKKTRPRGNEPNFKEIAGAILIEAEDYARGNVAKDRSTYGKDIGVLVNRGETPNFAEYDLVVERAAVYQLELRYAAAGSRPVRITVNQRLAKSDAAARMTGSWNPDTQTWFVECFVTLNAGQNVIRLEQPVFFPHIDKLLLTPVDPGSVHVAFVEPADSVQLMPSLLQQWVKVLTDSKTDSKSVLTGWHQYVATKQLIADPAIPENGTGRLLRDRQPESLEELAKRYSGLFADAQRAWKELKATDAGKDAKSLPDPVLESARALIMNSKGPFAIPADIEASFSADVTAQLKVAREEVARKEASIPKIPETMAVAELKPENLRVHLRGSHLTLGREVPRQLPRILIGNGQRELTEGSGRLELARWLANAEHPLTSRVMVNRIWQWHFGQGLVRTPDNFGRLGERPSHPALLDWLAREFSGLPDQTSPTRSNRPSAWSLKRVHRRLIETATYRQNAEYNPAAALADPENRLLWRFHRQRMDVEVLRDSLLAISGLLDETPEGTLLPTPNRAYVTSTANVNPAIYNSNRRSIYLPVVRSALFEVFTAFDFADPSTLAGQRDQTTVAPQALFMMNSQFVFDQSRTLARRLLERGDNSSARITELYQVAYGREAVPAEIERGSGYLQNLRTAIPQTGQSATEIDLQVWTSLCRAVLSANEFVYVE